jgi:ABC-2 type transport system permease protein
MNFVILSAIKDLRRMRRDPTALAIWIGMPLFVAVLMVAFFGHEQPKPQGLVLIADQDKSFISALVLHAYTQDKLGEMLTVQQTPLEEGRRRIRSGDGSALVIIPKGFGRAVLGRQTAQIQLLTNPSQSILPKIVESVTSVLLDGAWRLQQVAGDEMSRFSDDVRPSDKDIADSSIRYRNLAEGISKFLNPPVIKVDVKVMDPDAGRRQVNMGASMFPSMTFLAVVFLAFGLASDIWKEKMGGTLRHAAITPKSMVSFLGGKVLALWILYGLVGVMALVSGKLLIGAEIHNAIPAVLWLAACGGTMYLLLVLLHTFFAHPRGASTISNLVMMPMAMLGGCFFPFEMMPESLSRIGRWMPNGWALLRFKDIIAGQADHAGLALAFGSILCFAVVLLFLVAWRLRWKFL